MVRCRAFCLCSILLLVGGCAIGPGETVVVLVPDGLSGTSGELRATTVVVPQQVIASLGRAVAKQPKKAPLSAPASRPPTLFAGSFKDDGIDLAKRPDGPHDVSRFWTATHLEGNSTSIVQVPQEAPACVVIAYSAPQPVGQMVTALSSR